MSCSPVVLLNVRLTLFTLTDRVLVLTRQDRLGMFASMCEICVALGLCPSACLGPGAVNRQVASRKREVAEVANVTWVRRAHVL